MAPVYVDGFANIVSDTLADKVDELPYWLKIKGLIIYILCFGGAKIVVDDQVLVVEQVLIRQISTQGESRDFILQVDDVKSVLNQVLRYYVRSLSNPVLIHRTAIQEYARLVKLNKSQSICIDGARAKYIADFENRDLDKIREDTIFCSIAENYFEFMHHINGVNDIIKIGEIFSKLL